jgi:hypothetical protein
MKACVSFSGGLGSWAAAKLAAEKYGRENTVLVFADTMIEHDDLYRFLPQAAANVFAIDHSDSLWSIAENLPAVDDIESRKKRLADLRNATMEYFRNHGFSMVWLAEGRTPWEVFRDVRFLGNSRVDPCSKILKRDMLDRWIEVNCPRPTTIRVVGLGHWERHRFFGNELDEADKKHKPGLKKLLAKKGWICEAPLTDRPDISRYDLPLIATRDGLDITSAYDEGFLHDNCGGECVKAGQGHWVRMFRKRRDRFLHAEKKESELREMLGNVAMLKESKGGRKVPLPLSVLRERIEAGDELPLFDGPPCGCFTGN